MSKKVKKISLAVSLGILIVMVVSIFSIFGMLVHQKLSAEERQSTVDTPREEISIVLDEDEQEEVLVNDEQEQSLSSNQSSETNVQKTSTEKKESSSASKNDSLSAAERKNIRAQYLKAYDARAALESAEVDETQFVVYQAYCPSVSVLVSYEDAQQFLNSKTSKQDIIQWNILDYSSEIYLEYYNELKNSLPQNTEFRFHFQVVNPWASKRISDDEAGYWKVLSESQPIQIKMKVLVKGKVDLTETVNALKEHAFEQFDGIYTTVEIEAACSTKQLIEDYLLESAFENTSSEFYSSIQKVKETSTPDENTERNFYPGEGASVEMKAYYDLEKAELREKYAQLYKDCLDLSMSTAEFGENGTYVPKVDGSHDAADYFILYVTEHPEINQRISYQGAENTLNAEGTSLQKLTASGGLLEVNRFLLTVDVYDKFKSELNEMIPSSVAYLFKLEVIHPRASTLYSSGNKEFYDGLSENIPLVVMAYLMFDQEDLAASTLNIAELKTEYAEMITDYFVDLPLRVTIQTGETSDLSRFSPLYLQDVFQEGSSFTLH